MYVCVMCDLYVCMHRMSVSSLVYIYAFIYVCMYGCMAKTKVCMYEHMTIQKCLCMFVWTNKSVYVWTTKIYTCTYGQLYRM